MGLQPKQVKAHTMQQLYNRWQGIASVQLDAEIEHWKRARFIGATLYNTAGKTWSTYIHEQRLKPLPGDGELPKNKLEALTQEQIKRAFKNK